MGVDFRTLNFDIRASGEVKCKNEYYFDNRSLTLEVQLGKIGVLVNFTIQKLNSKHLL